MFRFPACLEDGNRVGGPAVEGGGCSSSFRPRYYRLEQMYANGFVLWFRSLEETGMRVELSANVCRVALHDLEAGVDSVSGGGF